MKNPDDEYKYFGIPEVDTILQEEMKDRVIKAYFNISTHMTVLGQVNIRKGIFQGNY